MYGGGDGIAFWLPKEAREQGPIFGNRDKWTGLAIILSTNGKLFGVCVTVSWCGCAMYDLLKEATGRKVGNRRRLWRRRSLLCSYPSIAEQAIGHCEVDFRNNDKPVWVRVSHYEGYLIVSARLVCATASIDVYINVGIYK